MLQEFLEAGQIVNTHGIQGEVKLQPWVDSPGFLLDFPTLYIDGAARRVAAARVHKTMLLLRFEGVEDVNAAMRLKGKTVYFARKDAHLEPGRFFLADLIGLAVRTEEGAPVGVLTQVMTPPAQNIYVVEGEAGRHMIPAVPEFIKKVDIPGGEMVVSLIEGM